MPDQSTNHDTYECLHCGAFMGIAGESTGSLEDVAADDYYDEEVRRHESGECVAVAAPAVEVAPVVAGNVCGHAGCTICAPKVPKVEQPRVPVQCRALLPCPTCAGTTDHLFSLVVNEYGTGTQAICMTCDTAVYADLVTRSVHALTAATR